MPKKIFNKLLLSVMIRAKYSFITHLENANFNKLASPEITMLACNFKKRSSASKKHLTLVTLWMAMLILIWDLYIANLRRTFKPLNSLAMPSNTLNFKINIKLTLKKESATEISAK